MQPSLSLPGCACLQENPCQLQLGLDPTSGWGHQHSSLPTCWFLSVPGVFCWLGLEFAGFTSCLQGSRGASPWGQVVFILCG